MRSEAYYAARIRVPLSGDPCARLSTASGTPVAVGFRRVVIGGRGPYVEFDDGQVVHSSIARENVPHYYYDEWRTLDTARVKLYRQMATVGYADYLVGMWYVAPALLFLPDGKPLMDPSGLPIEREDEYGSIFG